MRRKGKIKDQIVFRLDSLKLKSREDRERERERFLENFMVTSTQKLAWSHSSVTPNFLSSNQTFFTLPPIKSHELDYKIFISPIFVKETNVRWKIMYDSFFFDLDTRRIIILDSKTIVPSSVLENSRGSISYSLSRGFVLLPRFSRE